MFVCMYVYYILLQCKFMTRVIYPYDQRCLQRRPFMIFDPFRKNNVPSSILHFLVELNFINTVYITYLPTLYYTCICSNSTGGFQNVTAHGMRSSFFFYVHHTTLPGFETVACDRGLRFTRAYFQNYYNCYRMSSIIMTRVGAKVYLSVIVMRRIEQEIVQHSEFRPRYYCHMVTW